MLEVNDSSAAEVAQSYVSVTLAPNVHVHFDGDISLIDTAGFEDSRDYIGTIGVSCFLKILFETVREVKFVIVMDETMLEEETGTSIVKTFNGFINMFKFDKMS